VTRARRGNEDGGTWVIYDWNGMYLRAREPGRRTAPVEVLEGGTWKPSELTVAGLRAIEARRLDPDEVRRLRLPE
jgi:hypothetical protein